MVLITVNYNKSLFAILYSDDLLTESEQKESLSTGINNSNIHCFSVLCMTFNLSFSCDISLHCGCCAGWCVPEHTGSGDPGKEKVPE